jgi:hypothetical protein
MGGSFVIVEGQPMLYVARWDGLQWNPLGAGLPTPALALEEIDGVLYAGGNFGVRAWNGSAWTTLGGGVNGTVRDFTVWGGRVMLVGEFTNAGGQDQAGVAAWEPATQSWLDPGFDLWTGYSAGTGRAVLAVGDRLYVSGAFSEVELTDGSRVGAAGVAEINDAGVVAAPVAPLASRSWLKTSPNPFNPRTVIDYGIAAASSVSLDVFDVRGRRVATLVRQRVEAGAHRTAWDGQDDAGRPLASGVYFLRLQLPGSVSVCKVVLAK